MTRRVVFDCNVYFQALISPTGPAGECVDAVKRGELSLFTSERVVDELRDICRRPHLVKQFALTDIRVNRFLDDIRKLATIVDDVPHVFDYPRDPNDEHYVDLAVAVQAQLIVSRDKDLLALQNTETEDGKAFRERFPDIHVLTPTELIQLLRSSK